MTEAEKIEIHLLAAQLGRMRAMQYAYNRKFFSLLLVTLAAIAAAFLHGSAAALSMLAFGLVTAGVTASFFLHFCDFARTHARALEARINAILGKRVLLASELEADYFYPHETAKISGFVPAHAGAFFSFFTLHFTVLWGAAIVAALWTLACLLSGRAYAGVLSLFASWAAVNVAFLLRWFRGEAERRMAATLRDAYETRKP